MPDISNHELDKLFQEAAAGIKPKFDPEDWEHLARRLEQEDRTGFARTVSLYGIAVLLGLVSVFPGREVEVRSQESGVRSQKLEVRSQESEVRSQESEVRSQAERASAEESVREESYGEGGAGVSEVSAFDTAEALATVKDGADAGAVPGKREGEEARSEEPSFANAAVGKQEARIQESEVRSKELEVRSQSERVSTEESEGSTILKSDSTNLIVPIQRVSGPEVILGEDEKGSSEIEARSEEPSFANATAGKRGARREGLESSAAESRNDSMKVSTSNHRGASSETVLVPIEKSSSELEARSEEPSFAKASAGKQGARRQAVENDSAVSQTDSMKATTSVQRGAGSEAVLVENERRSLEIEARSEEQGARRQTLESGSGEYQNDSTKVSASDQRRTGSKSVFVKVEKSSSETARDKQSDKADSLRAVSFEQKERHAGVTDSISSASQGDTVEILKPVQHVSDSTRVSGKDEEEKEEDESIGSGWFLKLPVSPDLTSIGYTRPGKAGLNIGLLVEFIPGKHLGFSTGAIWSRKLYSTENPGKSYGSGPYTAKANFLDGDCRVLDIPVNVTYYFALRPRTTFFATAGLSSYIMLKEKYTYTVTANNHDYYYSEDYTRKNNEWFSMLNLSIGIQRQIGARFWLQAEPFLKAPLSGIGEGKVDLVSMGAFFTLKYQLNK